MRIINNVGFRDHTGQLFIQNGILPIDDMIKFAKLKFMHCFVNRSLPLSFHELWQYNRDDNPARVLRNANNLRIPPHHFATLKRLPMFNFPQVWNDEDERKHNPSLKNILQSAEACIVALFSRLVVTLYNSSLYVEAPPPHHYVFINCNLRNPPSPPPSPPSPIPAEPKACANNIWNRTHLGSRNKTKPFGFIRPPSSSAII